MNAKNQCILHLKVFGLKERIMMLVSIGILKYVPSFMFNALFDVQQSYEQIIITNIGGCPSITFALIFGILVILFINGLLLLAVWATWNKILKG